MGTLQTWYLVMYLCTGGSCLPDQALPPALYYVRAWCDGDLRRRLDLYSRFGVSGHQGQCTPVTEFLPKTPYVTTNEYNTLVAPYLQLQVLRNIKP